MRGRRNPADFPPVAYLNGLMPFNAPQGIPSGPGNLPPNGSRLPVRVFDSGSMSLVDDFNAPGIDSPLPDAKSQNPVIVSDPARYAHLIEGFIVAVPVVGNQTQLFINAPSGRRNMLWLRNATLTGNIYIGNGQFASANSPIALSPGQQILLDTVVPQDDLYCFADAGATSLAFAFSNIPV